MEKEREPVLKEAAKKSNTKLFWVLLLLSVSVIWGSGFLVTDAALKSGMDSSLIMAGRFLVAAAVLFLARLFLRPTARTPFSKGEWIWGAIIGAVNFAGFFLQTEGLRYTTPERSGLITGGYVVLVPIFSGILKKEFKLPVLIVAVCFFIGMVLLTGGFGGGGFGGGDVITLISTLFFAAQILLVDRLKGINSFNFSCAQMLSMGVIGLLFSCAFSHGTLSLVSWKEGLLPVLYLGVFSSAYAYLMQTLAQRRLSPALTAIILSFESLFSAVFALMIGSASFSLRLIAGGLVMCVSSTVAALIDQVDDRDDRVEDRIVATPEPVLGGVSPNQKQEEEKR